MEPLSTSPRVPGRQALRQILMVLLITTGIEALVSFVIGLIMMGAVLVILRILAPAFPAFERSVRMLAVFVGTCIFWNLIIIAGWLGQIGRDWRQFARIPRQVLIRMVTRHNMAAAISLVLWPTFGAFLISRAIHTTSHMYLAASFGVSLLLIYIYGVFARRVLHR